MSKYIIFVCLLTLGACNPAERNMSYLSQQEIEDNQQRAQPLIEAINTYYDENHKYPGSIQSLNPEYLESIPKTSYDQDFIYKFEIEKFYVEFSYNIQLCIYNSADLNWLCP